MTMTSVPAGHRPLDDDDVRAVVGLAALAPSVHNTQPWRFAVRGDTLEVHGDAERRLDYLDPAGRQLVISCGVAVEYARLAVRALGRSCVVRLLPDGSDPDGPLATLTVGRPLAVTVEEQRLVDAVPRRHTDRGPYDRTPVGDDVMRRVRDLVGARGCWLRVLDRPGDRVVAAGLLQRAEEAEAADPDYRAELASWRRTGPSPDGVPDSAVAGWAPADGVSDVPLRDFDGLGDHPHPGDVTEASPVEHDTLVLLGSDDDSPLAWLRTGSSLGLAWLAWTDADVAVQPLGPVTDVPTTRVWLRRELGLIGQPQLLLRVGHGRGGPRTGRRPVEEILDVPRPR